MTRIISRSVTEHLYDPMECIRMMEEVHRMVSGGECKMLDRGIIPYSNGNALAVMPAGIASLGITGAKLAIFAGPETKKKKTQQGIIPLFSTITGELTGIVEAELVTVLRTAAVSAMATECLAARSADSLGMLGAGRLSYAHIQMISKVRDLKKIYLYSQSGERAAGLAVKVKEELGIEVLVCDCARDAVCDSDIVCTVTNSEVPVLMGEWIRPGAHINAVGACKRSAREVDTETLRKCLVYVDSQKGALTDAGDLLIPMEQGEVGETVIQGEIGEVLSGKISGRQTQEDRTLFESIGLPVQDLYLAYLLYKKACQFNLGVEVLF